MDIVLPLYRGGGAQLLRCVRDNVPCGRVMREGLHYVTAVAVLLPNRRAIGDVSGRTVA
jgi:hypothetical protein